MELKCQNAETPDKYGHYREARFSQIKHHWFWKVRNWIFCLLVRVPTPPGKFFKIPGPGKSWKNIFENNALRHFCSEF